MMFKFNIHSFVDVITNSSTVIYVYQDDIKATKELVQEILNLMGITDKTPDDIFYYGVFCKDDVYLERIDDDELPEGYIKVDWSSPDHKEIEKKNEKWLNDIKLSIMKGESEKPEWMKDVEDGSDWFDPDRYLHLIPKEEKFKELGERIEKFICSPSHEGGRDG